MLHKYQGRHAVVSVTTSVGDLHKAPFQSCSVRRVREDDRGSEGEKNRDKRHKHRQSSGHIGGKNEDDGLVVRKEKVGVERKKKDHSQKAV